MHTHTHKCAHGHTPQRRMFGKEGDKQPLFRSVRTNTISIDTFLFIYIYKSSWNLILLNCKPSRENSANETHVDIPQTHLRRLVEREPQKYTPGAWLLCFLSKTKES